VKILYGCLIASVFSGSASAASLSSAGTPEIISGVESCLAVTSSTGVDAAKLRADGWAAMSASENGKSVPTPMPLFSKGNLLLIQQGGTPTPICAIMAKVPDVPAVRQIVGAMENALKTARKGKDGKAIPAYWFPKGHIVELATTGTPEAPGIRIVVGYRK
jgi:hypothetical protein